MNNMYMELVEILTNSIFGGSVEGTMYGALIVEGISGIICSVLVLLPFIIIWRIVKKFL